MADLLDVARLPSAQAPGLGAPAIDVSQPGAGVRRERESIRRKLAALCPPHPELMIAHYGSDRGQIPRRICTRCFVTLPCQACGRERIDEPGDPCRLVEHCEARRPW